MLANINTEGQLHHDLRNIFINETLQFFFLLQNLLEYPHFMLYKKYTHQVVITIACWFYLFLVVWIKCFFKVSKHASFFLLCDEKKFSIVWLVILPILILEISPYIINFSLLGVVVRITICLKLMLKFGLWV